MSLETPPDDDRLGRLTNDRDEAISPTVWQHSRCGLDSLRVLAEGLVKRRTFTDCSVNSVSQFRFICSDVQSRKICVDSDVRLDRSCGLAWKLPLWIGAEDRLAPYDCDERSVAPAMVAAARSRCSRRARCAAPGSLGTSRTSSRKSTLAAMRSSVESRGSFVPLS
jgi:hypothetical protein